MNTDLRTNIGALRLPYEAGINAEHQGVDPGKRIAVSEEMVWQRTGRRHSGGIDTRCQEVKSALVRVTLVGIKSFSDVPGKLKARSKSFDRTEICL